MMLDILYVGMTAVFFALTWALVKMCESLGKQGSGERS